MPDSWIGRTIGGRYQIEALLGQGGMSAVYKATDPNLRRVVAIKLIHAHLSEDPNFVGRFKEEAAAVARLRHPNIVQVHDFNVDGDTYYMVMEHLVGETLQKRLRRLNSTGRYMSLDEAVRLCIQICEAAGYAHDNELVHRDIKPANIMLSVNGQAILMDFGIVKIIGGDYHTATGATIGTAMYMSPEQIRSTRVDERADIYSLGVTLYEMLSGQPPYMADSAVTLMMMVLNDPLPDLRLTRKGIPESLWIVLQKALAKEPTERFQTMTEMVEVLRQVQAELINSPPAPEVTQVVEQVITPMTPRKLEDKPTTVDKGEMIQPEQPVMDSPADILPNVEVAPSPALANLDVPVEATAATAPITAPSPAITNRKGLGRVWLAVAAILILAGLVALGWIYLSGRRMPEVQLAPIAIPSDPVNAQTAKLVVNLGRWNIDSKIQALSYSPDSNLLGTANNRDWERFSNYRFYSGVWQVPTGSQQYYCLGHKQWVMDISFSPDGEMLGSASDDKSVMLWRVSDGSLIRKIESAYGEVTSLDYSPNNMLLATGSWYGIVSLYQVSNGNLLRTMQNNNEYGVVDVDFSPDNLLLAAASTDNTVLIWQVSDGSLVRVLKGHSAPVTKAVFSPDGTLLASGSEDKTIKIWQVSDGRLLATMAGHTDVVNDLAFSTDGTIVASGADDGTLRLWRVSDGELLSNLAENSDMILSLAFSPDGYLLASGSVDGEVQFWGISEAIPLE